LAASAEEVVLKYFKDVYNGWRFIKKQCSELLNPEPVKIFREK